MERIFSRAWCVTASSHTHGFAPPNSFAFSDTNTHTHAHSRPHIWIALKIVLGWVKNLKPLVHKKQPRPHLRLWLCASGNHAGDTPPENRTHTSNRFCAVLVHKHTANLLFSHQKPTNTHMHSGTGTWSYWEVSVLDPAAGLNGEYEGIYSWQNASANPPHRPAAYTRSWRLPTLQTLHSTPPLGDRRPTPPLSTSGCQSQPPSASPFIVPLPQPNKIRIHLFWKVLCASLDPVAATRLFWWCFHLTVDAWGLCACFEIAA